jgi:hypothetical protein
MKMKYLSILCLTFIFNSCKKNGTPNNEPSYLSGNWVSTKRIIWDSLNPTNGINYPYGYLYPSRKDTFEFQDENLNFQLNGYVYFKSSPLGFPFGYPMLFSLNGNHLDTLKYHVSNNNLICFKDYYTDTLDILQIDNTTLLLYKIAALSPRKLEYRTYYAKK